MRNKSLDDMEKICWQIAKDYFKSMDKEHMTRWIEYRALKKIKNNELDSKES